MVFFKAISVFFSFNAVRLTDYPRGNTDTKSIAQQPPTGLPADAVQH
ncbi:hypothetical protein [Duganella qianjiadongensis]|uniref:Uncharacterized protein n=1 Tax=Duganella qianjiadongensis TaxID=2692176 RepID=A0ABW9VSP5_9BURK|nr:hypothetical protein [Duganella qianjiadongensis]MYM41747.1 hypothetical protein [Duganella qianjiadongensis]